MKELMVNDENNVVDTFTLNMVIDMIRDIKYSYKLLFEHIHMYIITRLEYRYMHMAP